MKTYRGKLTKLILVGCLFLLASSGTVEATLIDRGGGLVYDTDEDITWLQDAGLALSAGYDIGMTWHEAQGWAQDLEYYDSVRDVTWTDWAVARNNHYSFMYREHLGGIPVNDDNLTGDQTSGDVTLYNIQPFYWSSNEPFGNPSVGTGWRFLNGGSFAYKKTAYAEKQYKFWAWAVMAGDVGPAPISEPTTMFLLGSGLIGLVGFRRMFRKR